MQERRRGSERDWYWVTQGWEQYGVGGGEEGGRGGKREGEGNGSSRR